MSIAVVMALTRLPAAAACCTAVDAAQIATAGTPVDGYSGDQLTNAATIIDTGIAMRLDPAAAVLAVMTAMGESGLHDLPYGDDAINPDGSIADSIGLFQQQHSWGSRIERMNPASAAMRFYQHLQQVPRWQTMSPSAAAHAVQGNVDPDYYTPYYWLLHPLLLARPRRRNPPHRLRQVMPPSARARPGRERRPDRHVELHRYHRRGREDLPQ